MSNLNKYLNADLLQNVEEDVTDRYVMFKGTECKVQSTGDDHLVLYLTEYSTQRVNNVDVTESRLVTRKVNVRKFIDK